MQCWVSDNLRAEDMKQEIIGARTSENKVRNSPGVKKCSRSEAMEGASPAGLKARPRSVPPEASISQRVRRSIGLNKLKSSEDVAGSQKGKEIDEVRIVGRNGNRPVVEQFARPRRRSDLTFRKNEEDPDEEKKELQEKLNRSENLVKNLQAEIVVLKSQMQKLQSFNLELESENTRLSEEKAAAEAKISDLSTLQQENAVVKKLENPNFKDVQKLIANKLEHLGAKKDCITEGRTAHQLPSMRIPIPVPKPEEKQPKLVANPTPTPPLPPPPPPPLPRAPVRVTTAKRAPNLVEFYHTLTKQEGKKNALGPGKHGTMIASSAHSSIVGEIQNRSAHLLAIKMDVETKGEFINCLIENIQTAVFVDIEDILKFVDWLDHELSSLADERAVLKHFNWPERKADAMREAAIEYRELKRIENEVSSYKDDSTTPCEVALKKIASLLDKSEKSIQRLVKMRDSSIPSYRDCKIPFDWMLDSGMIAKIKQASMRLAKMYMKRVSMELESTRSSEKESTQEALLLQGVRFAYRTHQFVGGLDSETMWAFEEIRQRAPVHVGGSRELLAAITSPS